MSYRFGSRQRGRHAPAIRGNIPSYGNKNLGASGSQVLNIGDQYIAHIVVSDVEESSQSIWHKVASPPHMDGSIVFAG